MRTNLKMSHRQQGRVSRSQPIALKPQKGETWGNLGNLGTDGTLPRVDGPNLDAHFKFHTGAPGSFARN
jgi:hypothetical protein